MEVEGKTKAQLRAERRALQEAQRAAKAASKATGTKPTPPPSSNQKTESRNAAAKPSQKPKVSQTKPDPSSSPQAVSDDVGSTAKKTEAAHASSSTTETTHVAYNPVTSLPGRKPDDCRLHLFRHLHHPDKKHDVIGRLGLGRHSLIHPTFLALGVDYDEGRVCGSNERCVRFLEACKVLIRAYPSANGQKGCARDFATVLQRHVDFLSSCRPLAVTMRNAADEVKRKLNQLDQVGDWDECRRQLIDTIDTFRRVSIELAGQEIACRLASSSGTCIKNGDCIVTYAYSSLVGRALVQAHDEGLDFSVLVVDSGPRFDGRQMLQLLTHKGIACEYTHIGALPLLAHKVTLAVFGAHALLANGCVLSRVGTGQVANIITSLSRSKAPVLVCAETYKFTERAHSDAFEYNELASPDQLIERLSIDPSLEQSSDSSITTDNNHLSLLQLTYDLLPPELVVAVVTENGMMPTSSVPAVLRRKETPF